MSARALAMRAAVSVAALAAVAAPAYGAPGDDDDGPPIDINWGPAPEDTSDDEPDLPPQPAPAPTEAPTAVPIVVATPEPTASPVVDVGEAQGGQETVQAPVPTATATPVETVIAPAVTPQGPDAPGASAPPATGVQDQNPVAAPVVKPEVKKVSRKPHRARAHRLGARAKAKGGVAPAKQESRLPVAQVHATNPTVVAVGTRLSGKVYVVRPGDCLSVIAARYGTSWPRLAEVNRLANPDLIYPGQVLQIV